MKIAILTSGIMPVPAVQGGAVETLADYYLEYNNRHKDLAICLSNAILSLYRDKQRQQSMGEASRRLSERYAKELYARKFFESLV